MNAREVRAGPQAISARSGGTTHGRNARSSTAASGPIPGTHRDAPPPKQRTALTDPSVEQSPLMSEPLRAQDPQDAEPAESSMASTPPASHESSGPRAFPTEDELLAEIAGAIEPTIIDDISVEELRQRALEAAEAENAVAAVMQREEEKAVTRAKQETRKHRASPVRTLMAAALVLFNVYLWMGSPQWLEYRTPATPPVSYYESSYKIAVYMQRQRVEEFRRERGRLPQVAKQAGAPVKGVKYTPLTKDVYELRAGNIVKHVRYVSTDSIAVFLGRTFIQMGLIAGGAR